MATIKKLVIKVLYQFNSLNADTRGQTYKSVLIYVDVYNAIFVNTRAKYNEITQMIEFIR